MRAFSKGYLRGKVSKGIDAAAEMTTGATVTVESASVEKTKRTRKTHHKGE